jgi:hypothetical protein
MAIQLEKSGDRTFIRTVPEDLATGKPKDYQELGLCLALVVLVGWALYAGLHNLDWPAIGHTFKVFLAAIR